MDFSRLGVVVLACLYVAYDIIGPHAWRQTQTLTTALHFAHDDARIWNPQTNFLYHDGIIQRMEFPLYQWLAAIPIRMGLDAVITVRLFSFLLGILSMMGLLGWVRALSQNALFKSTRSLGFSFFALAALLFLLPIVR